MATETAPVLESLAVLEPTSEERLDARWLTQAGSCGLLVAVLGEVEEHDTPGLTRMRHASNGALAVVLDVPAWRGGPADQTADRTVGWLGGRGWRAVSTGPHDPIPSMWQELGSAGRSAPGRSDLSTRLAPEGAS